MSTLKRRWRRILILFVCLDLVVAGIVVYRVTKVGPSLEQVRSDLNAALPAGSSEAEIQDYLSKRRWHYDGPERAKPAEDTFASNQGIAAGTPLIITSFTDSQGDRRVTIYFVLDEAHTLQRILLWEFRYSP